MRNQFVILIGRRVHIPLTARNARPAGRLLNRARHPRTPSAPAARRASIAPPEIFGSDKLSAGTSVQNEPIYVVIPLRVDRSICGMQAALRISFTVETEPAYPPRAGPCGPPRSPPRRGGPLIPVRLPLATFPGLVCCGGTTPHTPRMRPSAARAVGLLAFGPGPGYGGWTMGMAGRAGILRPRGPPPQRKTGTA
jgi:hypothetical protein